jgi:hypothetical protein
MANTKIPAELSSTPGIIDNSNATAITIDSSENVGIGTSPENSAGTWRNLQFGGGNLAYRNGGANDAMIGTGYLFKTDNSEVYKNAEAVSRLFFDNSSMIFQQAGSGSAGAAISWSEAMRIDSSGNVGIGGTGTARLVVQNDGNCTVSITSNDGGLATLNLGDASDGSRGQIVYDNSNESLKFSTNNLQERMRIDSSGNLLVGKTSTNTDSVGFEARATGLNAMVRASGETLILGRNTSDGGILSFRKDGGTIGALATAGGDLIIGSHNTCLRFDDSADDILPTDDAGVVVTNTLSLGSSAARFKDLHLGGQVFFGSNSVPFESGDTLPSSTNYDSLFTNGHYRIDNNATNAPSNTFHAVIVFGNGGNVTTQLAVSLQATTTYIRSYNNAWTSWARLDT